MRRPRIDALRAFARDTRASAGLELALGAVVLLGVAALCFDLYARVEADASAARVAATVADYVSRGPDTDGGALDGGALEALGAFLHARALGATDLVLVISAFRQPEGDPAPAAHVLWTDDALRYGDATVTEALARDCARFVGESGGATVATLPDGFALDAGEVAVAVEVCARPGGAGAFVAGDIYRLHVVPARTPEKALPTPVHARLGADARARA